MPSYISVSIESTTLNRFLEEYNLVGFFLDQRIMSDEDWNEEDENEDGVNYQLSEWFREAKNEIYENYENLCVELKPSPALSLLEILNAIDFPWWESDDEANTLEKLKEFLKTKHGIIDKETECSIVVTASNPEDGFAYYQRVEATNGHGRLLQWPCAGGWTEEGYAAIQQYNTDIGGGIWDQVENFAAMPDIAAKEGVVTVF